MIQSYVEQTHLRTKNMDIGQNERPTEANLVDGFKWIVVMPGYLGGRPAIYGKRMSVEQILVLLANGATAEELQEHYKLDPAATKECLLYASEIVEHQHPGVICT
jgi:uncharacterized protein (DUF433 family)